MKPSAKFWRSEEREEIEELQETGEVKEAVGAAEKAARARRDGGMLKQRIFAAVMILLVFFIHVKIQKPTFYPRSKVVFAVGRACREGESRSAALPVLEGLWWLGDVQVEDELLTLVNSWNPIPADRMFNLAEVENGYLMDERCVADLQSMMNDCRAAGLSPLICSAYRTQELQETLFWRQVGKLEVSGHSSDAAYAEAAKSVAVPGCSEHQIGLAVDIVDVSYQRLNDAQENTAAQQWLMQNCWRYGFVLRYPRDKVEITGIYYEPWHYRYVGKDAATAMYLRGVCLEEYLAEGVMEGLTGFVPEAPVEGAGE